MTTTKPKTISRYDLEALQDFMDNCETRSDYSGRGMYGAKCFGFVTDSPLKIGYAIAAVFGVDSLLVDSGDDEDELAAERTETGERLMRSVSMDSMGSETIVYFPGWTVED